MKLSIVIPAYNEEKRLKPMLDSYVSFFNERYKSDVEFIIVVNGSRDRTEEVAKAYQRQCSSVRVIVEPNKIGKGGAIMLGFEAAFGELIGFTDADGSTPPEAFQDLVGNMGDVGCIIASRWFKESKVSPRQPWKRRLASRLFNGLVRLFFGLKITDTQCGAKVLKKEAVKKVLPRLGLTQWAFDVDLLFQLRRAGYVIKEWPTTWHDVGGSQLRIVRASFDMFIAICRLRLLYSPFRFVVTIYDRTLGHYIHTH